MGVADEVRSPSVEVALRSAGDRGLLIAELEAATDKSETTVRREVRKLTDEDKAHKMPTVDGQKVVWGPKPKPHGNTGKPPNTPRRKGAAKRDAAVLEALQVNGRLTIPAIAKIIGADDMEANNGNFSQSVYLSLRRLQRARMTDRVIEWAYTGPPVDLDSVEPTE